MTSVIHVNVSLWLGFSYNGIKSWPYIFSILGRVGGLVHTDMNIRINFNFSEYVCIERGGEIAFSTPHDIVQEQITFW